MPGRRRGARTGRGWDASPLRPRPARARQPAPEDVDEVACAADGPLWTGDEERYRPAPQEAVEPARDPAEVAREICLRQLAVRPRTRAELATALRRRGIDDDVAVEAGAGGSAGFAGGVGAGGVADLAGDAEAPTRGCTLAAQPPARGRRERQRERRPRRQRSAAAARKLTR